MPAPFGRVHADRLEEGLKAAYGFNHAIAVSSGTAALHSALIGCGAGPAQKSFFGVHGGDDGRRHRRHRRPPRVRRRSP
jgi:hypothetical protein